MEEAWDSENFAANKIDLAVRSNKWEGEDEEEEVKDSWEDVEEEKKDVEKAADAPKVKNKPKKTLADKIEEREKRAREEAEKKGKEKEQILSPEEKRAELLRQQRLQEEADLRLAMDTLGIMETTKGLDAMIPDTKDEFDQFGEALIAKINTMNKHAEFPAFAEELIKNIAVQLSAASLRKVKTLVDNLAIEKGKLEKGDKGKRKGKGKAKLRMEGENTIVNEYDDYAFDNEYDDFM